MEERISINEVFYIVKRRWKIIVLLTLVVTLIGGGFSYFVLKPTYQASTQIIVNQKNSEIPLSAHQVQTNVDFINTYSVIIKTPVILEKAINNFQINQSIEQLSQKITVNSQEKSQVFFLTVEDSNPIQAVEIANAVSETFQKEIPGIMNIDNVSILAMAEHPILVQSSVLLHLAIAVVAGLMAGIGLAFFLEYLDNTIRDDRDVESYLGLPVLGSIPKFSKANVKGKRGFMITKMGSEMNGAEVKKRTKKAN